MKVIKRDGSFQEFNSDKIKNAIIKVYEEVYPEEYLKDDYLDKLVTSIAEKISDKMNVEDIQDLVEERLMQEGDYKIAKAYITYRYLHKIARDKYVDMMNAIKEKIEAKDVQNQNANMDENSFGGKVNEASGLILKQFALDYCMSKKAKENHLGNRIYIHDLDHYALGDHNCFQRDTKLITSEGIKAFKNFTDGELTKVLCKDGKWREATIRYYGRQPMQRVTLQRCNKELTFDCTVNHRWILSDDTVTTNLKVGDRLTTLPDSTSYKINSKRESEIFALGFIIGDGCDHIMHNNLSIQVTLCDSKCHYAPIFEIAGFNKQSTTIKDSLVYSKRTDIGKQDFLSNKMWKILSFEDKRALFNGYMSADGSKTTNTRIVWTSDIRVVEMIKDISALSGYHIFKIKEQEDSTNFKDNRILYTIEFTTKYSKNSTWKVKSIQKKRNKDYEAWCVEEPETHSFTLEGGVITGNCLTLPLDDLLANGFKTRQTDVRPANSISTAMQLVAVLFQLQSLQQFGGVAASHLDWTMVPYVRKSFAKHYKEGLNFIDNNYNIDYEINRMLQNAIDYSIKDTEYEAYSPSAYNYAINKTIKECHQAVEALYHNLNTLQSRSGCQLPFTSINYGTCTLEEGRMVTYELLKVSIEGLGKHHRTSVFPCGIFQCMKGVNREPKDINYDLFQLALESTAKRLYPNYVNVDWTNNAGYDINDPRTYNATMGKCKLQLI